MECLAIRNEKRKIKKLIKNIMFVLILIILVMLGIIFHKSIMNNVSWEGIGVILAFATLIFTIISNYREKRKSILLEKNIRDQEKFENEVEQILEFYPQLIEDFIKYTNFPISEPRVLPYHFEFDSLDYLNGMIAKYFCLITTINNKVDYLYKFHGEVHPEYDKFRMKVMDINKLITDNVSDISNLVKNCVNGGVGFSEEGARSIIEKRTIYVGNITKLYQDNINELYVLANNAVEERNELSTKM